MHIDIRDPASEALLRKHLATGAYASAEAVIRRALEVLDSEETWAHEERPALDTKIARAIEDFDSSQEITAEEARARLEQQKAALQSKNLVELFADSPFRGLNLEFEKDRHLDYGREIEL